MGVGLRPGAKAPEAPPTPYRPRASPRLYTNVVGTLRTTQLYDRPADDITVEDIERIKV